VRRLSWQEHLCSIGYTENSILAGPDEQELDQIIEDMKGAGLVDLTVEGDLSDFLGVEISRKQDGTIHLTQPHLIDSILADLRLDRQSGLATKQTPAAANQLLRRCRNSEEFDGHFNYRSIIGKLNYLEKSTRPGISYAVHQWCVRLSAAPKTEHAKALKWLGHYLIVTRDKGLIFNPKAQSFDCHVDASFSGDWDRERVLEDIDTARSQTGFVISYASSPIIWTSHVCKLKLHSALRNPCTLHAQQTLRCNAPTSLSSLSMTSSFSFTAYPSWVGNRIARGSVPISTHADAVSSPA
jgi:hypothetical protein